MNRKDDSPLVYSTEFGFAKNKGLGRDAKKADKKKRKGAVAQDATFPDDGVIRVRREKSGRGGKTVTTIHGLPSGDVKPIGKQLKQACGSGGASKNGVVEIQGDHVAACVAWLIDKGYTAKQAGG